MVSELDKTSTTKTFNTEVDHILQRYEGKFQAIAERPHRLIEQILLQTERQPLLTQELCELLAAQESIPDGEEEEKVKHLLQNYVVPKLKYYLYEVLQTQEMPPPKPRLEPRKSTGKSPVQSKVIQNKGKKKVSVRTISLLVGLVLLNAAIVIGSPYIGILCRIVGNCQSYKQQLGEAQTKLDEARMLESQNQNELQSQRAQIEKAIEPLTGIPGNAQVYLQVEDIQQLAQKEIKIRQAKIFIEEANKAYLDALQTIEKAKDTQGKQSPQENCKLLQKAQSSLKEAISKEQEAIHIVEGLDKVEGLVQYARTLNQQILTNYQKLQGDTAPQLSTIPQCLLPREPIWNQQNQSQN